MIDALVALLELLAAVFGAGGGEKRPPPRRPLPSSVFSGALLAIAFQPLGLLAWAVLAALSDLRMVGTGTVGLFTCAGLLLGAALARTQFARFEAQLAKLPADRYPPARHPWLVGVLCGGIAAAPFVSGTFLTWKLSPSTSVLGPLVGAVGSMTVIVLTVAVALYETARASSRPPGRAPTAPAFEGEGAAPSARGTAPADLRCAGCGETHPSRYWFVDTPSGPRCQDCAKRGGASSG